MEIETENEKKINIERAMELLNVISEYIKDIIYRISRFDMESQNKLACSFYLDIYNYLDFYSNKIIDEYLKIKDEIDKNLFTEEFEKNKNIFENNIEQINKYILNNDISYLYNLLIKKINIFYIYFDIILKKNDEQYYNQFYSYVIKCIHDIKNSVNDSRLLILKCKEDNDPYKIYEIYENIKKYI